MADEIKINFTKRGSFAKLDETMTLPTDRPIVFGRSTKDADVYLEEQDVSGRHLEIRREGDGFSAVCLSRYGIKVNERKIEQGASVRIKVEDEIILGSQVRFRIKSLPAPGKDEENENLMIDGETVAMDEPFSSGTLATKPLPDETMATRPIPDETLATRPIPDETLATKPFPEETTATKAFSEMTMETLPFGAEEMVASAPAADATATVTRLGAAAGRTTTGGGERQDDTDDAITSDGAPETLTGDANSSSGETIAAGTIGVKKDVFEKMRQNELAAQKAKRIVKTILVMVILLVSCATIWLLRPKEEERIEFPTVDGKKDLKYHTVTDSNGVEILNLHYPANPLLKEVVGKDTFTVDTYNGQKRNVPYKLTLEVKRNADELNKSLAQSFSDYRTACEKSEKIVFIDSPSEEYGVFFFEDRFSGFSIENSLHGLAMVMAEYALDRPNMPCHGTIIYFRNGDASYILRREVPEKHWAKSKWLMGVDPNMVVFNSFNLPRWESPGKDGLRFGVSVEQLKADAREMLKSERVSNWKELEKTIDTLMVKTYLGSERELDESRKILATFRAKKDNYYKRLLNDFEVARRNEDRDKMQRVFNDCQDVFGADERDRRFKIFNNPEIWSCRKD